jgi:hypothetical protein
LASGQIRAWCAMPLKAEVSYPAVMQQERHDA